MYRRDVEIAADCIRLLRLSRGGGGVPDSSLSALAGAGCTLMELQRFPPTLTWWMAEEAAGKLRQVALLLMSVRHYIDDPGMYPAHREWLHTALYCLSRSVDSLSCFRIVGE